MGKMEVERKTTGWAARDSSGLLSPYTYNLRETGPEDVHIRIICCGICHTDLHQTKNDIGMSNYPMVPGHEVVGEVVEVGSGVSKFTVGDIVGVGCLVGCCGGCSPCNRDLEQYCPKKIWSYNDVYIDGQPTQGGFARATVVHQNLVWRAREDAEEWKGRKKEELGEAGRNAVKNSTPPNRSIPWKPPPTNWLKCNSDGAWNKNRNTSGLGWICRDESGRLVWAGARAVTKAGSPILAEAEALKWGAETLANFGYKNIIFESDSDSLVKMINGTEEPWPILLPIIEVIRKHLLQIGCFEVKFHARSGNKAADRIAKESITFVSSIPKLYSDVPLWLKYQVGSDKTVYQNSVGE